MIITRGFADNTMLTRGFSLFIRYREIFTYFTPIITEVEFKCQKQ